MLEIKDLHAYYGPIEALKGLNLEIHDGKIVCLIGSNGAGKTTLLKSISGMIRINGSINLNGEEIGGYAPKRTAKLGIHHVPEGRHVFPGLTVKENLEVGAVSWHGLFSNKSYKDIMANIYTLFPRLKERENQLAWSMSGGEQQMLAIGRAMMGKPKLLLLDEPSMGLAPLVVEDLFNTIKKINKQGMTILLVEQNAKIALEVSDYAYVIEQGKIKFEGPAKELRNDDRIIEAYLGKLVKKK